jgi:hypothetical protein
MRPRRIEVATGPAALPKAKMRRIEAEKQAA